MLPIICPLDIRGPSAERVQLIRCPLSAHPSAAGDALASFLLDQFETAQMGPQDALLLLPDDSTSSSSSSLPRSRAHYWRRSIQAAVSALNRITEAGYAVEALWGSSSAAAASGGYDSSGGGVFDAADGKVLCCGYSQALGIERRRVFVFLPPKYSEEGKRRTCGTALNIGARPPAGLWVVLQAVFD